MLSLQLDRLRFEPWLYFLVVWPWVNHRTSLVLFSHLQDEYKSTLHCCFGNSRKNMQSIRNRDLLLLLLWLFLHRSYIILDFLFTFSKLLCATVRWDLQLEGGRRRWRFRGWASNPAPRLSSCSEGPHGWSMLCCHCLKILNNFKTRSSPLLFCIETHK